MCKFNLTEAINTSIDPLAGWIDQKMPPQAWDYPMVAPPLLDDVLPSFDQSPSLPLLGPYEEGLIPDDLQDLFLGGPSDPVASLPTCEANCLLDELLSAPASPPLFGVICPASPLSPLDTSAGTSACTSACTSAAASPTVCAPEPAVALLPPPALSPEPLVPQQLSLERWAPALSPPLSEPFSPQNGCEELRSLAASPPDWSGGSAPDWSPATLAPPTKRRQARPRPYDKQARKQVSEEERRLRKKEQNKSAATRYRQKKKEEQEHVCTDQETLEANNAQLKERVNTLTRELSYLKHLMKEVIKFKRTM